MDKAYRCQYPHELPNDIPSKMIGTAMWPGNESKWVAMPGVPWRLRWLPGAGWEYQEAAPGEGGEIDWQAQEEKEKQYWGAAYGGGDKPPPGKNSS